MRLKVAIQCQQCSQMLSVLRIADIVLLALRLFRILGRLERNAKALPQPRIATHLCYRDDLAWM